MDSPPGGTRELVKPPWVRVLFPSESLSMPPVAAIVSRELIVVKSENAYSDGIGKKNAQGTWVRRASALFGGFAEVAHIGELDCDKQG